MEFLKSLSPEKRKKINIGLLFLAGLQFLVILGIQVFSSDPVPAKKLADLPQDPVKRSMAPMPPSRAEAVAKKKTPRKFAKAPAVKPVLKGLQGKKRAGPVKKLPPFKLGKKNHKSGPLGSRMAKAGSQKSDVGLQ